MRSERSGDKHLRGIGSLRHAPRRAVDADWRMGPHRTPMDSARSTHAPSVLLQDTGGGASKPQRWVCDHHTHGSKVVGLNQYTASHLPQANLNNHSRQSVEAVGEVVTPPPQTAHLPVTTALEEESQVTEAVVLRHR